MSENIENPDNLPIIDETSLHKIVATVKLSQEFEKVGKEKFEEKYNKFDTKTLQGACYFQYYKNFSEFGYGKPFELIKSHDNLNASLSDYLVFDYSYNQIRSKNKFYWKSWDIEDDTNRLFWIADKYHNNMVTEYIALEVKSGQPYVSYDFAISFGITIGEILNPKNNLIGNVKLREWNYYLKERAYEPKPISEELGTCIYFAEAINLSDSIFEKSVDLSFCCFSKYVDFSRCFFKGITEFSRSEFKGDLNIKRSSFEKYLWSQKTKFRANFDFSCSNSNGLDFYCSEFNKKALFNNSKFNNVIKLSETIFSQELNFSDSIFDVKVQILESKVGWFANFRGSIFKNKFLLESMDFPCQIKLKPFDLNQKCPRLAMEFIDEDKLITKFPIYSNLDLKNTIFESDTIISIKPNKENDSFSTNLENSTFEKKLYFNLKEDTEENYGKVTLNLYRASIQDFVCDDRNLGKVQLFYSTNESEVKNNDGKIIESPSKDQTEIAIAERRVFRKILQDLNWGDLADLEYAKIMDLQAKLETNKLKRRLSGFFFGWWLGWGVRFSVDLRFWKPKMVLDSLVKGGILWSSLSLAILFLFIQWIGNLINSFYSTPPIKCIESIYCRTVNLAFTANAEYFGDTIIVILSFLQLSLILVILARKFMRM